MANTLWIARKSIGKNGSNVRYRRAEVVGCDMSENLGKTVEAVELTELRPKESRSKPFFTDNLDVIKNVKVNLKVCVGDAEMSVEELFSLKEGAVIKLDRDASAPLDLRIDDRIVGRGQLVVVDDYFGVRLTEIFQQ